MKLLARLFFNLSVLLGLAECALLHLAGFMGALIIALSKMSTLLSHGRIRCLRFFRVCLYKETCLMWLRRLHQIVLERALFKLGANVLLMGSLDGLLILVLVVGFLLWLFVADDLLNLNFSMSSNLSRFDKLRRMHLILIIFLLLRYNLAVLVMIIIDSSLLSFLLLRSDGEPVAFELALIDLDFFLLLLVVFHALFLGLLFLVVLLINIDLIIVDFGSLLWMLDIIWRILFVKLSLLEKVCWLETNDRHLSLSINFTLFFLLHLVDLILWHFILPLHLD